MGRHPCVTTRLLDNIVWHTLTGPLAPFATGQGGARRYAHGFSPILGFEDRLRPDFVGLQTHCAEGELFYVEGWRGDIPHGWRFDADQTMHPMVWDAPRPKACTLPEALPLTAQHAPAALELAVLTRPGPFGLRTTELGEYLGWLDGSHLVAMAGERMCAGTLREISGVCMPGLPAPRPGAALDAGAVAAADAARRTAVPACDGRQHRRPRVGRAHGLSRSPRDRGARAIAVVTADQR